MHPDYSGDWAGSYTSNGTDSPRQEWSFSNSGEDYSLRDYIYLENANDEAAQATLAFKVEDVELKTEELTLPPRVGKPWISTSSPASTPPAT